MTVLSPARSSLRMVSVLDALLAILDRVRVLIIRLWPAWLFSAYFFGGWWFASKGDGIQDAYSRIASAWQIAAGFEPHLTEIGFVWGPIPVVPEIPFAIIGRYWAPMITMGLCATIVTAGFGILMVYQAKMLFTERGLRPATVTALCWLMAFNPMLFIYSSNGMSEIPYIALLMAGIRYLSRWETSRATLDLAAASMLVGLATWDRYEALVAMVGLVSVVILVLLHDTRGQSWRERRGLFEANLIIAVMPTLMFFGTFILFSWTLTGQPLAQFTSQQGNNVQILALLRSQHYSATATTRAINISSQLLHIAPVLPFLFFFVLGLIWTERSKLRISGLAIFGLPLIFDLYGLTSGIQFDFMRYYIQAIMLVFCLGVELTVARRWGATVAVAAAAITALTVWTSMGNPNIGSLEYSYYVTLTGGESHYYSDAQLDTPHVMAQWFDRLSLPPDSVLTDPTFGGLMITQSRRPYQFATSNDRNFLAVVNAPYKHHVRYVITVPSSLGTIYPINAYFPTMFNGCVPNTQLAAQFVSHGLQGIHRTYRVYKITGPISPSGVKADEKCLYPTPPNTH